jgi:mRNA interferase HicA
MKRTDLIRTLEECGCVLIRHGGRHDWYRNPNTGISQSVPRHREINKSRAAQTSRKLKTGFTERMVYLTAEHSARYYRWGTTVWLKTMRGAGSASPVGTSIEKYIILNMEV